MTYTHKDMHIQGHTNKIKNAVKIRVKNDGRLRKLLVFFNKD